MIILRKESFKYEISDVPQFFLLNVKQSLLITPLFISQFKWHHLIINNSFVLTVSPRLLYNHHLMANVLIDV